MTTPIEQLDRLLGDLFEDGDLLRRFLRKLPHWRELRRAIPGRSAAYSTVIAQAVDALQKKRWIDRDLFVALLRWRPREAERIVEVAAAWEVPLGESDIPEDADWDGKLDDEKDPPYLATALISGSVVAVAVVLVLLLPDLFGPDTEQTITPTEVTPAPVLVRHAAFDRKLAVGETVELTCETPGHEECAVTAFIERGDTTPLTKQMAPSGTNHSASIDVTDDLAPLLRYWFETSVCDVVRAPHKDSYTADVLPRVAITHSAPSACCSGESMTLSCEIPGHDDCVVTAEIVRNGTSVATVPLSGDGTSYSGSYSIPPGTSPGALKYRLRVGECGVGEWPGGDGSQTAPIRSRTPRPLTFPGASLFTGNDLVWKVELPCQSGCSVKVHWWRGEGARRSVSLDGSGTTYEGSLFIDSSGADVEYFIEADPPCSGRWPATGHKNVNIL